MLAACLGFFSGFVGAVAYVMIHSFPAQVRFTGLSFSFNISYAIFGGLTPTVIVLLQHLIPQVHVWYLAGMGGFASLMGFYLMIWGRKQHLSVGS